MVAGVAAAVLVDAALVGGLTERQRHKHRHDSHQAQFRHSCPSLLAGVPPGYLVWDEGAKRSTFGGWGIYDDIL